jgi:hypothetical protein
VRGYARDVGDFLRWYGAAALERLSVVDLVHYREHRSAGLTLRTIR